jgi:hypothetical protein
MTDSVWMSEDTFEASSRGGSVEFSTNGDGGCWVGVESASYKEVFVMSKEQFESFKEWAKTA